MSHRFKPLPGLRGGPRVCRRCGMSEPTDRKCPGDAVQNGKKARLRKKKKRQPGNFDYRVSRFALGARVRSKEHGLEGVVAGFVRRKVRWRKHRQWRQTPIVRFDGGKLQKVCDDTDLELVDG